MIQQAVKVLWNKKLSTAYYKIGLTCSDHYSLAKPGQFVMLGLAGQTEPLLRRPLSCPARLEAVGLCETRYAQTVTEPFRPLLRCSARNNG